MASEQAMKAAEGHLIFEESGTEINSGAQVRLAELLDRFRLEEARWWHKKLHWAIGMPCDGTMEECKHAAELEQVTRGRQGRPKVSR